MSSRSACRPPADLMACKNGDDVMGRCADGMKAADQVVYIRSVFKPNGLCGKVFDCDDRVGNGLRSFPCLLKGSWLGDGSTWSPPQC